MSDKEKDIPVKEQEDGSALIAVEPEIDPFAEDKNKDEPEAEKNKDNAEASSEENDEAEDHVEDYEDSDDSEEERERIREARREERKLKKQIAKERELTAKNKIASLERRNEELAKRLAAVESTAVSFRFAQVDKAIEDEATRVEYAKMKMLQAAQSNDAAAQVEYLEQLTEAKKRLEQIQAYKKHQIELARQPKQNVPTPVNVEVQRNATDWLKKNKWYDPQARDTDSRIAKVVDQELADEGWDPSDPEYWEELDNRLQNRLPHRYAAKTGNTARRVSPTASARTANPTSKSTNTITLSRDRVQAIKDAGAWDNPALRNKMIKAYAEYDKQNRKG